MQSALREMDVAWRLRNAPISTFASVCISLRLFLYVCLSKCWFICFCLFPSISCSSVVLNFHRVSSSVGVFSLYASLYVCLAVCLCVLMWTQEADWFEQKMLIDDHRRLLGATTERHPDRQTHSDIQRHRYTDKHTYRWTDMHRTPFTQPTKEVNTSGSQVTCLWSIM